MADENPNVIEAPVKQEFSQDEKDTLFYYKENNLELPANLAKKVEDDNAYFAWLKDNPPTDEPPADEPPADKPPADEPPADKPPNDDNDTNNNKLPPSLSAMLKELNIEEFNDDVVNTIKTKFKDADEVKVLRDAVKHKDELLSVKPEEKLDPEILELSEFKNKYKLPVKAAASLLGEIKSYDPLKDDATTALMIQFKMDNPDYKGSEEKLKEFIENEFDITNENDKFYDIKKAKLDSAANKAIARINEAKAALSNRPVAADYEAILSNQKAVWEPVVDAIVNAKEGIPSINFEMEGEKYSIVIPKEAVAAMKADILDAVRGMDIKDPKSINDAYRIVQAKYLQSNIAKIIHETAKGLKTAHTKEVEALNKAKETAVKAKEKEVEAKYTNPKNRDGRGRNIVPTAKGNLTNEQIMVNQHLESKGHPPHYITGKEEWKDFKNL